MKKGLNKTGLNKAGQLTVFIIIALIIIAAILIILYPRIRVYVSPVTPSGFMQDCMSQYVDEILEKIEKQGGSYAPENIIYYDGNTVEYLCYTNEYYKTCKQQQPLLRQHIEQEISDYLKPRVEQCINQLASDYESKGYQVSIKKSEVSAAVNSGNIKITANSPVTLSKASTESYEKFTINKLSELYNLVMIAGSILNWEARYGDSNPETYMIFYPNVKVEKLKQQDGSKIYILTDRETNEQFTFATRSLSWPVGYQEQEFVK